MSKLLAYLLKFIYNRIMSSFPQRKPNRLTQYDYSQAGVYFVTICAKNRIPVFWNDLRLIRDHPDSIPLSEIGLIVDQAILKIADIYPYVVLETYCIMPDHLHLLLRVQTAEDGRTMCAPTVSRIVKHLKEAVTKQIGQPIWQKSYYDHVIKDEVDHQQVFDYIESNPAGLLAKK